MQEPEVKVKESVVPVKKEKLWWEEELELAAVVRHPDDPEDALGQRLLEAQSLQKVKLMDDATTCLILTIDNGNFIVLNDDSTDE
jgi:hypothetical protein